MTTFDERERAFETKFALEQERVFLGRARGTRALGEWAALQLGLAGEVALNYVHELRRLDVADRTGSALVEKIVHDFDGHGVRTSAEAIRARWDEARLQAIVDLGSGR